MRPLVDYYKGKRVLVTGNTGFKGSWMCEMLLMMGADVYGYAIDPPTDPSLYELCGLGSRVHDFRHDVRDLGSMKKAFKEADPQVVIHMAAQPIVRTSYEEPVYTYETNVMGTVNVLECVRLSDSVESFLNVTTDKVYLNREWIWGYRESEELNGFDPYSNSKSCSDIITSSYRKSFKMPPTTTARAGNVIGGGDFAKDRIIPDCIRSVEKKEPITVRNPYSTRPYQHVLEPVYAYLMIAAAQASDRKLEGSYNVGPDESDCRTTGDIVDLFCEKWKGHTGEDVSWQHNEDIKGPHEASFLKLDCSKLRSTFDWKPRWTVEEAMDKIVEWTKVYEDHGDVSGCMQKQIAEFMD